MPPWDDPMDAPLILETLRAQGSEHNRQGMARYGINTGRALGVSIAAMRPLARQLRRRHGLALELWKTGVHEARILACLIADPAKTSVGQLETWVQDLDSWDLTDQFCNKLAVRTPFAWELAERWAGQPGEFIRRAGFSLMAQLAVHDASAPDQRFIALLEHVRNHAQDGRNFVKKAVNWTLRQIGKRNPVLRGHAVDCALRLLAGQSKAARWIARDALRELQSKEEADAAPAPR